LAALKGKIDEVRGLRGEQVREVERVEGNFSKAIFEYALIEHQTVRLSEIAHLITKGSSPNWQGINYIENEGVLFITSENVRRYKIRLEPKKFVETRFNEIEKKSILRRDDILMNIVGASIGRTAIYDRDDVANINQAVCLIRLDTSKIDLEYALHFFNSPVCIGYMFDKQVDAARANLSMGNISNFLIPIPDLTEQRRIVAEIQAFQTKMEQLKAVQAGQLAGLEGLFPAVLERAFRGEW
jgi:type I restriction enzyme S subunit